jgi:hypothetical protein
MLAVAAMVATVSPAWAQLEPLPAARPTAGWVLTPAIAFGAVWDTNPTTQNIASPTGSETVGLVSPRTTLTFTGRRASVSAGYSGTLERYQELTELTRYSQRGRLDSRYQMTPRLAFETRNNLTSTPTTDDLQLEGVPFVRVGSQMITSTSGFDYAVSPRSMLKSTYEFQWVNFDRGLESRPDFRFLQGGRAHMPGVEYFYAVSRRVKAGALYSYRHMVIDAGEEIFGSHRTQATVDVQLAPYTSVYGRAGFDYLALRGSDETTSGPSYAAGITQRIRDISLTGSFERSIVPSFGFGGLVASNSVHAGVTAPFGRLSTAASFTYRKSDPVIRRDVLVELESYWTSASVGYLVTRWLRVEGFLSLNQQYSSARGDVERTRVGVQFVTSKPVRIQ